MRDHTYAGNCERCRVKKMRQAAYLFDRYGPSTAYAVCFTVNALCLLTGFPWLQENKKVSQQLRRHTDGKAKRGSHGGARWGFGRVCCCVCARVWDRETGGEMGEVRACVLSICGETRHRKNKSFKRSSKWTDKQTSVTNSSNTDVQVQKKKFKLRDQTKTTPDTSQHRGDQGDNHTSSHDSALKPFGGDPSLCLRPRVGP